MKSGNVASPNKLSHLVLRSPDVGRMRDWYIQVLNAKVAYEKLPHVTFLRYDDEHHRLGIQALPADAPPLSRKIEQKPLHHFAFGYENIRALLATYERLRDSGIRPVFSTNHGPTMSIYYEDPDGNGVELMIERYADAEGAQAFLDNHFDERGPGIDFDVDRLVERMHAGASDEELTAYDWQAPVVFVDYGGPRRLRYPSQTDEQISDRKE